MSDSAAIQHLPSLVVYPERAGRRQTWLDRTEVALTAWPMSVWPRWVRRRESRFLDAVSRLDDDLRALDSAGLESRLKALRERLPGSLNNDRVVAQAFALVREVSARELGTRHFDVQVRGGFALLCGRVAEMETGEGKTLTAVLASATAALAGLPVHIVTVNDYLAERDAATMGPIYRALGLTVGMIVHGMAPDDRRKAYACDVTYGSNKEMAFDYLRDRLAMAGEPKNLTTKLRRIVGSDPSSGRVVMRGLHFAIVDEADSVLVDEARTPLIISRETDAADERQWAEASLLMAETLQAEVDYRILRDERRIELTAAGRERLESFAEDWGGIWESRIRREESARQALTALHLFQAGDHYLVRDGKVQIVDEYTGRVMADRSWSEGLHQLVEAKENCPITSRKVPIARMTYQRFFRRYQRLAGMTGTAHEVAGELWKVYQLPVLRIPTHRPPQRQYLPTQFFSNVDDKWFAVSERAAELSNKGRPILIGTRSVAASEAVSQCLDQLGVEHVVLSAAQDQHEAEVIAQAGQPGRVTVATNMAGRGVDIQLGPGVMERGGLHVILTERHDARRIDRQLAGRCGRQGDPGSVEAYLSFEDTLLELLGSGNLRRLAEHGGPLVARRLFRQAQRRAEQAHGRARYELLKQDRRLGTILAFSGGME